MPSDAFQAFSHRRCEALARWMLQDGRPGGLNFLLLEIWGRPAAIGETVAAMGSRVAASSSTGSFELNALIPESRVWKLDLRSGAESSRGKQLPRIRFELLPWQPSGGYAAQAEQLGSTHGSRGLAAKQGAYGRLWQSSACGARGCAR